MCQCLSHNTLLRKFRDQLLRVYCLLVTFKFELHRKQCLVLFLVAVFFGGLVDVLWTTGMCVSFW